MSGPGPTQSWNIKYESMSFADRLLSVTSPALVLRTTSDLLDANITHIVIANAHITAPHICESMGYARLIVHAARSSTESPVITLTRMRIPLRIPRPTWQFCSHHQRIYDILCRCLQSIAGNTGHCIAHCMLLSSKFYSTSCVFYALSN